MWSSSPCLFLCGDIRKDLVMAYFAEKWLLRFCARDVVYAQYSCAINSPHLIKLNIPQPKRLISVEFHIVVIIRIQRVLRLSFGLEFLTVRGRSLDIVRREA